MRPIVRIVGIISILALCAGCDQLSKNIVRDKIGKYEQIILIDNFLTLTKVENDGAFLSTGSSLPQPLKSILLNGMPVLILTIALLYVLTKKNLSTVLVIGICLVIGGGLGNIYDRMIRGSVTDFLHMDFIVFQTGIFNLADVSIMTGMVLILFESAVKKFRAEDEMETSDVQ
jgi:signal peptidase II